MRWVWPFAALAADLAFFRLLLLSAAAFFSLAVLDGLAARRRTGLGPHGAPFLDDVERGADDGALGLYGAGGCASWRLPVSGGISLSSRVAGARYLRNALLVLLPEENGPRDAARVLR